LVIFQYPGQKPPSFQSLNWGKSRSTLIGIGYNSLIRTWALKQLQLRCNSETENKLHVIEPRVDVINLFGLPRRDKIIIHRLRIGHTYLTHVHLLWEETVEHVLLTLCFLYKCSGLLFCATLTSISECFRKTPTINFVRATWFYCKIEMHVFTWLSIIITLDFIVYILFEFFQYISIYIVLNCWTCRSEIVFNYLSITNIANIQLVVQFTCCCSDQTCSMARSPKLSNVDLGYYLDGWPSGRPSAVNVCPFVTVDLNLWPTVYI